MKHIKTRFAPSPTGYLHVGGLRTALYAYLFARQNEGTFLLRIEDTDQTRLVEGAAESLMESLKYFGLQWDEGPFFQSKRTEIYQEHAKILLESGHAYRCFCTAERLEEMRATQMARKQAPKYDRHCHRLSPEEIQNLLNQGRTFVVRQLIPQEVLEFDDVIRGKVQFHGKDVDDQVLIKSDGYPTYHLANVVDDHLMEITHVIRGEEWLPSTPKHIWLYQSFGWQAPTFAHLPLLLNADKSKLSKRQGDVGAEDYIKKGYLKEALINFIAFLGWNPGTEEELFTTAELIHRFSLDRVQKAGAVFSLEKLDWLNGLYLRERDLTTLTLELWPFLQKADWFRMTPYSVLTPTQIQEGTEEKANDLLKFVHCIQTRLKTLAEAPDLLRPFLLDHFDYQKHLFVNEKMKADKTTAILALENSLPALEALDDYSTEESIKTVLTDVIQKLGLKNGQVLWPMRVALSNEEYSPGVFELMLVLGKERSLKRLRSALYALQ